MNFDCLSFTKVVADETRQEIINHLCCVWLSVNELVDKLDGKVNQPTVSHHLKKLEEANLVLVQQDGRQRFYTLNQEYFSVCCGMLERNFVKGSTPPYVSKLITADSIPIVERS